MNSLPRLISDRYMTQRCLGFFLYLIVFSKKSGRQVNNYYKYCIKNIFRLIFCVSTEKQGS